MNSEQNLVLTVSAEVNATLEKVWQCFTEPQHIVNWNFASDDWHCPAASADFVEGGKFSSTMAAKDGSFQFDFNGVFDSITPFQSYSYTMEDGRKVWLTFESLGQSTVVVEKFEPENQNSHELQTAGWQAILNQFKSYTENLS